MASSKLLIIYGMFLAIFILVLCEPIPSSHEEQYVQCRAKAFALRKGFEPCMSKIFEKGLNETRSLYGDEGCLQCQLLCRNLDAFKLCYSQIGESLKNISNKSEVMVPFLMNMIEETFQVACENDGEIILAINNESNKDCLQKYTEPCTSHIERLDDWNQIFFCDYTEPEKDIFTPQFVCQKTLDALECAKLRSDQCSDDMKKIISKLALKLRNSTTCSSHY